MDDTPKIITHWMPSPEPPKEEGKKQEIENNSPVLRTTYETPEECPECLEHLSLDWAYCPSCGRPTDWYNPNPLTLDELREMDGEPIWCRCLLTGRGEWGICKITEMPASWHIAISGVSGAYGGKDAYGEIWLAYKAKPNNH